MMTELQFDMQLQVIQDQSKAKMQEAIAGRDQGFAKLFLKSEWTQDRIAHKVGKTQPWVTYRTRFGRFLDFITVVINLKTPRNLTEGRFRKYWEATSKGKEQRRFQAVAEEMEKDLILSKPGSDVAVKLIEAFSNWTWRTADDMSDKLGEDRTTVGDALGRFKKGSRSVRIEERKYGATTQYRLKVLPNTAVKKTVHQLADEIAPLCRKGIKYTRDSNKIEYSREMTAGTFDEIEKLVQEVLGKQSTGKSKQRKTHSVS